jgi:hypothetical protein
VTVIATARGGLENKMLLYNRIVLWHCRVGTGTEWELKYGHGHHWSYVDGSLMRQPGRCQHSNVIVEFIYDQLMHFHLAVGKDDSVCVSGT